MKKFLKRLMIFVIVVVVLSAMGNRAMADEVTATPPLIMDSGFSTCENPGYFGFSPTSEIDYDAPDAIDRWMASDGDMQYFAFKDGGPYTITARAKVGSFGIPEDGWVLSEDGSMTFSDLTVEDDGEDCTPDPVVEPTDEVTEDIGEPESEEALDEIEFEVPVVEPEIEPVIQEISMGDRAFQGILIGSAITRENS